MSFSISVHREEDDDFFTSPPPDAASIEFDRWFEECLARQLYENPLGSDGTVYDYWHVPAHKLGLELLSRIYDHGLKLAGADLDRLDDELRQLEVYWEELAAEEVKQEPVSEGAQRIPPALHERMRFFQEALTMAKKNRGVLEVS